MNITGIGAADHPITYGTVKMEKSGKSFADEIGNIITKQKTEQKLQQGEEINV